MIELAVIYVYIFLCNHNPEFSKNNCTHVYFREFLASELVQPLSDARADPDSVLQQEVRKRSTNIDFPTSRFS